MTLSRREVLRGLGVCAVGVAAASACATEKSKTQEFAGRLRSTPLAKPTTTLVDTDGAPFDFAARTADHLTLLFFGYTSCPDVCPVQLGVLAGALSRLRDTPAANPNVVFVGVDVKRDTPEVMRQYLARFDQRFIGLTGDATAIEAMEAEVGVPPPVIEPADSEGNYSVGHASQILVYTPDNLCHIEYPFGVRQQDWINDLPRLATRQWPTKGSS